jgi:argonaute-like protein implicated in RNA metabolism and viral defense
LNIGEKGNGTILSIPQCTFEMTLRQKKNENAKIFKSIFNDNILRNGKNENGSVEVSNNIEFEYC